MSTELFKGSGELDDATLEVSGAVSNVERSDLAEGSTIERYVILRKLGAGGMGEVYLAYDPKLDRQVALKLLPGAVTDAETAARLQREAMALARLSHPNVVAVHDVGTHQGQTFIAMEHVEGLTLRAWLEKGSRSWTEILEVLLEAGKGLAAAHEAGLVHRDFKPGNVMVGPGRTRPEHDGPGRVRVLDFGLARATGQSEAIAVTDSRSGALERSHSGALATEVTRVGVVIGTPAYMAPEQLMGAHVDARSDQFAFCVVLHRALFGTRPFEGKTPEDLLAQMQGGQFGAIPGSTPVPLAIRRAIRKGLSVAPADRHENMQVLLQVLRRGRQARRRAWTAVGTGLTGIAAVAGWWSLREAPPCRKAAEEMSSVWNGDRAQQLRSAFISTKKNYAESAAQRAIVALDEYAKRWTGVRIEACESTHVHHRQSESLMDRRVACLDDHLHTLDALVSLYEGPDAPAVKDAAEALANLPDVERCSPQRLADERVIPPPQEAADAVARLREELAQVRARLLAGRSAEARDMARELLTEAEALDYDHLHAAILLELGRSEYLTGGTPDEVRHLLERSVVLAERAGDDALVNEAMLGLARHWGARLNRADHALWLTRLVEARGAATGLSPAADGLLHQIRGGMLFRADRVEEARAVFRAEVDKQARTALERINQINALQNLAITYGRVGEFDQSTDLLEQALTEAEAFYGPEHPRLANIHASIANDDYQRGELTGALEHAKLAERLWKADGGDNAPDLAIAYLVRSSVHHRLGEHDEAYRQAQKAYEVQRSTLGDDHPAVGSSLNNLATMLIAMGRPAEALDPIDQALALFEKTEGPQSRRLPAALDTKGLALMALGRHQEAKEVLARAYAAVHRVQHPAYATGVITFSYARSLWEGAADDSQRREAVRLAREAEKLLAAQEGNAREHAEVQTWLHAHPAPG